MVAIAISLLTAGYVYGLTNTRCAGAAATCPISLTRVISQGFTFNEDGADSDSRGEGDTNTNLQVWDAGTDSIGLGATPTAGAALRQTSCFPLPTGLSGGSMAGLERERWKYSCASGMFMSSVRQWMALFLT